MSGDIRMLVDIDNHKGKLARDINSMAIVNVDKSALMRDQQHKSRIEKDAKFEIEIKEIKTEINDIRRMLISIMDNFTSHKEVKKIDG